MSLNCVPSCCTFPCPRPFHAAVAAGVAAVAAGVVPAAAAALAAAHGLPAAPANGAALFDLVVRVAAVGMVFEVAALGGQ